MPNPGAAGILNWVLTPATKSVRVAVMETNERIVGELVTLCDGRVAEVIGDRIISIGPPDVLPTESEAD